MKKTKTAKQHVAKHVQNRHAHFAIIGFANEENEGRETKRSKTRSKPTRHFANTGFANEENEDRET
jgi:hypothetical protein